MRHPCLAARCLTLALLSAFVFNSAPAAEGPAVCKGLISDKAPLPLQPVAALRMGESFVDPRFGTRWVRVTDVMAETGVPGVRKPMYSTIPAWNADESLMILYQTKGAAQANIPSSHLLYDGRSYRFIKQLRVAPSDLEHIYWDPKSPNHLYYPYTWEMSGRLLRQLIRYDVVRDTKEVMQDFDCAGRLDFGHPKYMSWDGQVIGLRCVRGTQSIGYIVDLRTGTKIELKEPIDRLGVQVAPSGKLALAGAKVIDVKTGAVVRTLITKADEHATLGSANGVDLFVSAQYDGRHVGTVVTEELQSGKVQILVGKGSGWRSYPPSGTHVSAVAFKHPGWVAASIVGHAQGRELLDQEVIMVSTQTGHVCRLGHHRSHGRGGPHKYWGEPHAVISPSGTRVLLASDWGGGPAVDSYVIELPAYQRNP